MYIKVKVQTGAKREVVTKKSDDHYLISVREPAERNLANTRIREIISSLFNISVKSVHIISGHQSPSKIISILL
jgi:uncharacterized protein YggU (UPF0235/DUF167 family)